MDYSQRPEGKFVIEKQPYQLINEHGTTYRRLFIAEGVSLWLKEDMDDGYKLRITACPLTGTMYSVEKHGMKNSVVTYNPGLHKSVPYQTAMLITVYSYLKKKMKWKSCFCGGDEKFPRIVCQVHTLNDMTNAVTDAVHAIMKRACAVFAETGKPWLTH